MYTIQITSYTYSLNKYNVELFIIRVIIIEKEKRVNMNYVLTIYTLHNNNNMFVIISL